MPGAWQPVTGIGPPTASQCQAMSNGRVARALRTPLRTSWR
jgi:hypothetical protein